MIFSGITFNGYCTFFCLDKCFIILLRSSLNGIDYHNIIALSLFILFVKKCRLIIKMLMLECVPMTNSMRIT